MPGRRRDTVGKLADGLARRGRRRYAWPESHGYPNQQLIRLFRRRRQALSIFQKRRADGREGKAGTERDVLEKEKERGRKGKSGVCERMI